LQRTSPHQRGNEKDVGGKNMKLHVTMLYDAGGLQGEVPSSDVIVLPELCDGGYSALGRGDGIHSLRDSYVESFRIFSKQSHCTCVAGSLAIRDKPGKPANRSLVFRNGNLIHHYDKIHLFRPGGDTRFFRAGSANAVFTFPVRKQRIRAGVIICYDLRFPELVRMLARATMQILFVPARWPVVRDDAWQTLLKARAIENQIFVIGCNAQGKEGGYSYVFDPLGRLVVSTRQDPAGVSHEFLLDLDVSEEHTLSLTSSFFRSTGRMVFSACHSMEPASHPVVGLHLHP
jgi:omega-amidase